MKTRLAAPLAVSLLAAFLAAGSADDDTADLDDHAPPPQAAVLQVTVTDSTTKAPIPAAFVTVLSSGNEYLSAQTGDDGVASITLPPGSCTLTPVYKDGYDYSENQHLEITAGQTILIDVPLVPQPTLSGVVLDRAGAPLPHADLAIVPHAPLSVSRTDASGRFDLNWLPVVYRAENPPTPYLLVRHVERNLAAALPLADNAQSVEVTALPAVTLAGSIADPDSAPIPGAIITLLFDNDGWLSRIAPQAIADDDGRFQITALPDDSHYRLTATADGFSIASLSIAIQGAPGTTHNTQPIILSHANLSVSGIVLDENRKPVASARVFACGEGPQNRSARTDKEGKFKIDNLFAGPLQISASLREPPLFGSLQADAGAADLEITLLPPPQPGTSAPARPTSLLDTPLPALEKLSPTLDTAPTRDAPILVCFWDMNQRSLHDIIEKLAAKADDLAQYSLFIVAVDLSGTDQATLDDWAKKHAPGLRVLAPAPSTEKILYDWAVLGLPWLVLTDKAHEVTAEGFPLDELESKLNDVEKEDN